MSRAATRTDALAAVAVLRPRLEALIQAGIDLLDELDAALADMEPDAEDEVISEDDGVVVHLRSVGDAADAMRVRR
jgi:hypothetical protein